jgi:hypothetical protein
LEKGLFFKIGTENEDLIGKERIRRERNNKNKKELYESEFFFIAHVEKEVYYFFFFISLCQGNSQYLEHSEPSSSEDPTYL